MQPYGYQPNFIPEQYNPHDQRFYPLFLPFLGGLAGGLLTGGLINRPPYGYYPQQGPCYPPYCGGPFY